MRSNFYSIALYTIVRREVVRMFRIASQVFLPPIITTGLYFLIFGKLIGSRIGEIAGLGYGEFIAPGLVMMSVITNAYGNVSTSLFSVRFQRSIEELLVSPMSNGLILTGYVIGGIIRGLIVGILVTAVAYCFVSLPLTHPLESILVIILAAGIFSLAGFSNAMVARNFDDVMIVPTFILAPLTYLGGVFYTTSMLSPFWQGISHLNPILYMVNALRHCMIGVEEVSFSLAIGMMCCIILGLALLNLWMLKRGIGLRD